MKKYVEINGGITSPKGFMASGIKAGIKKVKPDMALIYSEVTAAAAACYTQNSFKAAPVILTMEHLKNGEAKAIIVNSGNANACTGVKGMEDANKMAWITAAELGIEEEDVAVASTGVIGVNLPMDKIEAGIKDAVKSLDSNGGSKAAEAIMTTDTFVKEAAIELELKGQKITIGAIAKGSGMIHPNMATMLSFITTDANISSEALSKALKASVEASYNMITVDGDSSTNDMVICLANGIAGNEKIEENGADFELFKEALHYVNTKLAKLIAMDGEGATKLLEIKVVNACSIKDAQIAAKSVAGSSLVKAAFYGEDANWGRIFAALGYSGAKLGNMLITVTFISENGNIMVAENGKGIAFDEKQAKEVLQAKEITVLIDLQSGDEEATAWGCDLSYDYVKINASYRS